MVPRCLLESAEDPDSAKLTQHLEYPDAPVYGGSDKIPALTHLVKDGDTFTIGENVKVKWVRAPSCLASILKSVFVDAWLLHAIHRIRSAITLRMQLDRSKKGCLLGECL